jgi:CDP-diacylglycerol pyrophosphatase
MSEISMIRCDNQGCKNQTTEDNKDGWIRLTSRLDGTIYDGDATCESSITQRSYYQIPNQVDFCCLKCFLNATGLT